MGCGSSAPPDTLADENIAGPERLVPVDKWDPVEGTGTLVDSVPIVTEPFITLTQECVSFSGGPSKIPQQKDTYKVMDATGKVLLQIPHHDPDMLNKLPARSIASLEEKDWPRSFKPIPIKDGSGKVVAALVASNDPGTGVPETEPWYYKILGAKPRSAGQNPMMTLQGTALYQWTRQEFTGASINDPSACVYFSTPEQTTETDTFGAGQDSSGCFYKPRKAPSFSLKSQMTLDMDVLNFLGKNLVSGVRKAQPCLRTKRKDKETLTVWVGKGADPAMLICATWAFDLQKDRGRPLPAHLLPWAFAK
jgi:hypothetical protein